MNNLIDHKKHEIAEKMSSKSKALKKGKGGFDYKGMMRDLDKAGFGGVKTSSLKGKSIRDIARSK